MNFLKKILAKKNEKSKGLEEAFAQGLISKEEFLRFKIIKSGISLEKAEAELKKFLSKATKKKKSKK